MLVVWLVKTSKTSDTIILTAFSTNNQFVPHLEGGDDNKTFALNLMGIGWLSGEVCANAFPSIMPMMVLTHVFGGDYASRGHKNILNECPLNGLHKIFCFWKVRWDQYILHVKLCLDFFVLSIFDIFLLILLVTTTNTHSNLIPCFFANGNISTRHL